MRDVQKTQYFNILYFRTSNGIIRDNPQYGIILQEAYL